MESFIGGTKVNINHVQILGCSLNKYKTVMQSKVQKSQQQTERNQKQIIISKYLLSLLPFSLIITIPKQHIPSAQC